MPQNNLDQLAAMRGPQPDSAPVDQEPAQDDSPELDMRSAIIKGIKAGLQRRAEARAADERMMLAKATAVTAPIQGQGQQPQVQPPMPQQPQQPMGQPVMPPAQMPMPQPQMPAQMPQQAPPQMPQQVPFMPQQGWPPRYTTMPSGPEQSW